MNTIEIGIQIHETFSDIFRHRSFLLRQDIRKITRTLFCINVLEVWPYKKRWPLLFWYEAEKRALWILKMIFLLWEKSLEVRKWWLFDPITDITLGAVKLHSSSNAVERRAQKWSNNLEGFSHPITMAFWGIRHNSFPASSLISDILNTIQEQT